MVAFLVAAFRLITRAPSDAELPSPMEALTGVAGTLLAPQMPKRVIHVSAVRCHLRTAAANPSRHDFVTERAYFLWHVSAEQNMPDTPEEGEQDEIPKSTGIRVIHCVIRDEWPIFRGH